MVEVGALDVAPQSFPIFGFVVGDDHPVGEVEQLPDVLLECLRTTDGQLLVMRIGALGRSVALEPYGDDGDVLVGPHGVDGGLYLAQLRAVAAVVGEDVGPVDREVDEGRTRQRPAFHGLGLGPHVDQFGEESLVMLSQCACVCRQQGAAATPVAAMQRQLGTVHPLLVNCRIAIAYDLRFLRGQAADSAAAGEGADAVAHVVVVTPASVDADCGQVERILAVDQARREHHGPVGVDAECGEVDLHLHGQIFAVALHGEAADRYVGNDVPRSLCRCFGHASRPQQGGQHEYCSFHIHSFRRRKPD